VIATAATKVPAAATTFSAAIAAVMTTFPCQHY
jgi:hypothetical protein